jgi:hypothetical protein
MTFSVKTLACAAIVGTLGVPAAAQSSYPYQSYPQYQQPYGQYQQPYGQYQQPYGQYQQPYGQPYSGYGYQQNPVGTIIDQLLGNRYSVTDRQAVSRCASAAMAQAQYQYRGYAGSGLRVTGINDVQRRSNGLRVTGTMSSGYGGYSGAYGYQNRGYGAQQLSFRCNVDYRGAVTNIRIGSYDRGYRRD